jgi:hypothetical protein
MIPDEPAIAALRGLARSVRLVVWIVIEVVVGVALAQLPLFGVLGYEHALVATLVGALVSLDVGIALARRSTRGGAFAAERSGARVIAAVAACAAVVAVGVTAIPGVIVAVHGIWTPTCDWGFGIRAFVSMVSTGAIVFAGAGAAIGFASGARRGWVPVVGAVLLVLGLALAGLWRFYSEPPVFTYDALLGYFPGNLYDENIQLGAPLYWSRVEQLCWVVASLGAIALFLDGPSLRLRRPLTVKSAAGCAFAAGLVGAIVLHVFSGRLGYAVDAEDIQAQLAGRRDTAHFTIYYAETPAIERDLELIVADHEVRLAQVARVLELDDADLAKLGRLRSYYFGDADQKAELMGARGVEMAKPWRHEIYLDHRAWPVPALRHEIAHAVASLFGDPWFGVASQRVGGLPVLVNPGLVEGLAVAVDWPGSFDRALTPHQAVKAMQAMGLHPSPSRVMGLGFLSLSSQRSYTIAGSFVRFLLETYGADKLKRLYGSGGDFASVYGKGMGELEGEWAAMIATVPLGDDEVEIVREMYRHEGIFQRPCPHAVAAQRERAAEAAVRGDRDAAIRAYRDVCEDSGGEPRYRLELAELLATSDDAAQEQEGLALLAEIAADAQTSSLRADALEDLGRLAARAEDWTAAEKHFAAAAALPLDDGNKRTLEALLFAVRHRGAAGPALRAYFFGTRTAQLDPFGVRHLQLEAADRMVTVEPALGVGWYLRGLQKARERDYTGARADLEIGLALGLPSPRFVRNAARQLLTTGWRAGDQAAVLRAATVLERPGASQLDRQLAADWRDRVAITSR